jgi:hypothetical protein
MAMNMRLLLTGWPASSGFNHAPIGKFPFPQSRGMSFALPRAMARLSGLELIHHLPEAFALSS